MELFFQKKIEQILKEENDLKEKLQNETTKIKEQLEKYWSMSNNEININEKIKLGIEKLKNDNFNIFKQLSYISKISKNKKQMKILSNQLMKNIKIFFDEKKRFINYEEYYFNGAPNIYNIEFKDILYNSFNVFWDIEINNEDNIIKKYKVQIKKENEISSLTYETCEKKCFISNLNYNTNYELRISPIFNNSMENWSKFQKIKTLDFDSKILKNSSRKNEFLQKLLEWSNAKKLELLYRGTKDGMTSNNFHNICDNQGPTITIFQSDIGNIFGGYASISWQNNGDYKSAPESFLFSLVNKYNVPPTLFPSKKDGREVKHCNNNGPTFGNGRDIGINSDFLNSKHNISLGYTYNDVLGKGNEIFGNGNFKMIEIEVFKVFK